MAFPTISSTHTDIWLTFWNTTFKEYLESLATGGGGWPAEFTQNGRLISDDTDTGAAQLTGSPALAVVIPDGAQYVVGGVLHTADGEQAIVGLTPNAINWLEVTIDGEGAWDVIEHATRPAAGSGVLGKVTTGASSVTDLDTSESESDVILSMPLLLSRLNGGAPSEGEGAVFWELLKRSAINPQTIPQFVAAEIEARIGGTGANLLPPEIRDEVMVNTLHSMALHQNYHNDAFEQVSPHHAIIVSPGRGTGAWAYVEITDEELTTMPVDPVAHEFGSTT